MDTNPTQDFDRLTKEEGKLPDHDKDSVTANKDLMLSEEQSCQMVRGISLYMGWGHIPDFNSASSSADDNPLSAPSMPAGFL